MSKSAIDLNHENRLAQDQSPINGNGIFAKNDITKGSFVHKFTGTKHRAFDMFFRVLLGKERRFDDPLQLNHEQFLSVDQFSISVNHGCDPNCGIKNEDELFAIRDIKKGEEITFDYSTTVSPNIYWWKMACNCSSAKCRKIILPADMLPPDVFDYYKSLAVLPAHVQVKRNPFALPGLLHLAETPLKILLRPFAAR